METRDRGAPRTEAERNESLWVFGELVTPKVRVGPQDGPPPHIQHEEDELLYVLEGEFELLADGESARSGAGSVAYVPRRTLHTYENVGAGPGRLLIHVTPGGLLEGFFRELGEVAEDPTTPPEMHGPPDVAGVVSVAARYGMEVPL